MDTLITSAATEVLSSKHSITSIIFLIALVRIFLQSVLLYRPNKAATEYICLNLFYNRIYAQKLELKKKKAVYMMEEQNF